MDPQQSAFVLKAHGEVDGCIVCLQCLGARYNSFALCTTGKPFAPKGDSNPFRIRTHSENRKGAAIQSLLPPGFIATTLEINPTKKELLFHLAKTAGNNYSDMACRTKLEAVVKGDMEKLTKNWRPGWHRVTFYGYLRPQLTELCERLKLTLIEEA